MFFFIEFFFSIALFVNAFLFIPQAIKIWQDKSAKGVSLVTFVGFLIIQFAVLLHGLINKDYLLVLGYLLSMFTCGAVIYLAIKYRKRSTEITIIELIKHLPGYIYWKDSSLKVKWANQNMVSLLGHKSLKKILRGTASQKSLDPKVLETEQEIIDTGQSKVIEECWHSPNGRPLWLLTQRVPVLNQNKTVSGILSTSLDITHSTRRLTEQLSVLERIIAMMPGHVYWVNREGVYLGCNDAQAKSAGLYSREEIVGRRNEDLPWNINNDVLPQELDLINEEVMVSGKTLTIEEPGKLPDGKNAIFLSIKSPLFDQQGKVIGMVGISLDITERKRIELELIRAKEAAELANTAKTEFLYNMKHDLRTPFTGILGIAEMLESMETEPNKKELLATLVQSAKILLDHVNEIFQYITSEDSSLPILEKQFDLYELLEEIKHMYLPAAKNKNLGFSVNLDNNVLHHVIGDKARLQRILINLISNAIKFSHQGAIKLSAKIGKEEKERVIILFIIEDEGIGIPDDKQTIIFEPFNRLTPSYSNKYQGKGLGLRTAKKYLDDIHGEIHLTSVLGKGTTIKLLIPLKKTLLNCAEEEI